jgi:methylmalonyl-CoA carboxyltransferase 5S subunit
MDVFRVFDALNDIRNLRRALQAVRRTGKHAQGTICYTVSPLHTIRDFIEMAKQLRDLECASICIKDMAALLKPQPAFDLVRGIKEACGKDTVVHVHVHSTTGVTMVSLMKAIEAGADIVDTSISSLSLGPGQNPTEALVEMLEGTPYATRLKKDQLLKIKEHFARVRPRYAEFESKFIGVETEIFDSQIPGGMISNMESQLKQQGAGQRIKEVLAEVPNVRKVAGYPPLVTPSSQIVGTQAVLNVLMGPYKVLTGEFADLMLGYYGATMGARDPEVVAVAAKHAKREPITGRPADRLRPEWEELRAQALALTGCNGSDEDVLTYAMFPQVAPKFLAHRAEGPKNVGKRPEPAKAAAGETPRPAVSRTSISAPVSYQIKIGDRAHKVTVEPA